MTDPSAYSPPPAAPPPPAPPPQRPRRRGSRALRFFGVLLALVSIWLVIDGVWLEPTAPGARDLVEIGTMLLVVLFAANGFLGRRLSGDEVMRSVVSWGVIAVIVVAGYAYRAELASVGGRVLSAFAPGVPLSGRLVGGDDSASVVVIRGRSGQFAVRTHIDEVPLTMLIDTGASYVTLTLADAAGVGIDIRALNFTVPIRTANGLIRAAPVTIDHLVVGTIERTHLDALVAPADSLTESLLGMSFLETLGSYAISGDRLTLTD